MRDDGAAAVLGPVDAVAAAGQAYVAPAAS